MIPDEKIIQSWIEASKKGDENGFRKLVEIFAPKLQTLIYRIVLDWEETRDVAQETFVQAYRALPKYQYTGKFQAWLFQIGVRKAYDLLRKKKSRPKLEQNDLAIELEFTSPHSEILQHETIQMIERAIQSLPAEQRIAFVMSEYEDSSNQEIATVLKTSVKSVEMHLYRARLSLRKQLNESFKV